MLIGRRKAISTASIPRAGRSTSISLMALGSDSRSGTGCGKSILILSRKRIITGRNIIGVNNV